jgi:SAM-dependent methyltransferase
LLSCGSGRIINILLEDKFIKEIFAVDKDKSMIEIVKPYFKDNKNVHIINQDIKDFLEKNGNFDLILTMMNTFGNIDSLEIMKLVAKRSKNLIFTVYDRGYWKERKNIYEDKGHRDFDVKNKDYYFNDCWVKGLKSKSYTEEDLKKMCEQIGKKYKIEKISTLLFLVHIFE